MPHPQASIQMPAAVFVLRASSSWSLLAATAAEDAAQAPNAATDKKPHLPRPPLPDSRRKEANHGAGPLMQPD